MRQKEEKIVCSLLFAECHFLTPLIEAKTAVLILPKKVQKIQKTKNTFFRKIAEISE